MSALPQFYFEPDKKRGTVVDAPETTDWETVFKRQRAIQGICGKTQPVFSELWIQQVSCSTEEKVRAFQKTGANPNGTNRPGEILDWLDSPDTTAEAQLLRFDSGHLKTQNSPPKRKDSERLIQWKAPSQSVTLFDEGYPVFQSEIQAREKFHPLIVTPVSVRWPQICEKMRRSASAQIRQLTDHLESLRNTGYNLLTLCSDRPGSGCTTILLLCAREISSRGLKTLLIDGNFSHPSLAEAFQLGASETTLWSLEDNLDLFSLEPFSERAKTLFQDACFSDWMEVFRDHYDLVLIDSGSLSEQGKYSQLKQFGTDGVFLIVDDLEKSRNSIEKIRQSLVQQGIAFLGLAENHVL